MPGHKGSGPLGFEHLDLTEIHGADNLYEAEGIIRQSEENASSLFGCRTFYAAQGSSQCIHAMLYLAMAYAKSHGRRPLIAAARNVHKTFLSGCALLDLNVVWLYPEKTDSYLSCQLTGNALEKAILSTPEKPTAVYLTSPDYLGNLANISEIAEVCHRHEILLLVDNAHGAYLRFLSPSQHPMDLGADLCCDSAHKTLPVLTGGAYLHLADALDQEIGMYAKQAMAMFGSTSPSYLILQSLDAANPYLEGYREKLSDFLPLVEKLKQNLTAAGYRFSGDEPIKLTLCAKEYGYLGTELAQILRRQMIECEFSDQDYLVLMLTPNHTQEDFTRLETALLQIPRKEAILERSPVPAPGIHAMSMRQAMLSPSEILPVEQCEGRILASPSVGCPPAVPIAVCGERIDSHAVQCFKAYGIHSISVVKET